MTKHANKEQVSEWCAEQPHSTLEFPFGDQAAVYKVGGKMFALLSVDDRNLLTVKTDPDEGEAMRAEYECVSEGYHMNKRHWITIDLPGDIPPDVVEEAIIASHQIVFASLSKKIRAHLGATA
jgi:predicted DNA-binding protein (MmcQ/YjbR family)